MQCLRTCPPPQHTRRHSSAPRPYWFRIRCPDGLAAALFRRRADLTIPAAGFAQPLIDLPALPEWTAPAETSPATPVPKPKRAAAASAGPDLTSSSAKKAKAKAPAAAPGGVRVVDPSYASISRTAHSQ
jgi:hypothetical protein